MQCFNPLITGDADASGIPALIYRTITNISDRPLAVSVCGSLANTIGYHRDQPLPQGNSFALPRATAGALLPPTGRCGAIVRSHRLWQLTGDTARLAQLWPGVRKALEFAWIADGWDGNRDGVMEGCQHNTMDVEYHGPVA